MTLGATLEADAAAVGVTLAPAEVDAIVAYGELLARWNRSIRLVGPDDVATILREQIVDALGFVPAVRALGEASWWDIGAGGGLPGLVLARLVPETRLVMVEPTGKKTAFLSTAAAALGLANVVVHQGRVEPRGLIRPPLPPSVVRPRAALSRATFAPKGWLALAAPLVGEGGGVLIATATPDEVPEAVLADPATARWTYRVPATGAPRALFFTRRGA